MSGGIGLLRGSLVECEARAILILGPLLMELWPGAISIGWAQNPSEMEAATIELDREEKSYWRSLMTNLTTIEVDSLHHVVREMQDEGSIANYEFLVRNRGADYEVLILAEIVDVVRWAAVRGLDVKDVATRPSDHVETRLADDPTRPQPRTSGPDPRQVGGRSP